MKALDFHMPNRKQRWPKTKNGKCPECGKEARWIRLGNGKHHAAGKPIRQSTTKERVNFWYTLDPLHIMICEELI